MLLNEFFGKAVNPTKELEKDHKEKNIGDDLFWYIVDHDRLHTDYLLPLAKKMKQAHDKHDTLDKESTVREFMPMVKKGCQEYYHHAKLKGHPEKIFTKDLQKDMCEKLFDHFREDVIKDKYKLGQ
jgi:hypothetical protein